MFAIGAKETLGWSVTNVRFVSKADVRACAKVIPLSEKICRGLLGRLAGRSVNLCRNPDFDQDIWISGHSTCEHICA
jgi:hypothetical protein